MVIEQKLLIAVARSRTGSRTRRETHRIRLTETAVDHDTSFECDNEHTRETNFGGSAHLVDVAAGGRDSDQGGEEVGS